MNPLSGRENKYAEGCATGKGLLVWQVDGVPVQATSTVLERGIRKGVCVVIDSNGSIAAVDFNGEAQSSLDVTFARPKAKGARQQIAGTSWE